MLFNHIISAIPSSSCVWYRFSYLNQSPHIIAILDGLTAELLLSRLCLPALEILKRQAGIRINDIIVFTVGSKLHGPIHLFRYHRSVVAPILGVICSVDMSRHVCTEKSQTSANHPFVIETPVGTEDSDLHRIASCLR